MVALTTTKIDERLTPIARPDAQRSSRGEKSILDATATLARVQSPIVTITNTTNAKKTAEYASSAPFRCAVVNWWAQKLKPNVVTTNAADATRGTTNTLRTSGHFFARRNRAKPGSATTAPANTKSVPATPAPAAALYANWVTARDCAGNAAEKCSAVFTRLAPPIIMIDQAASTIKEPVRRCVDGELLVPTIPDPYQRSRRPPTATDIG